MAQVISNLPKEGEEVMYVDVVRKDGKDRLCVDASIVVEDIEIGAVEIKNAIDDTRATVIAMGSTGALVTADLTETLKSVVNIYGDASGSYDTPVTLATYTVPSGKTFRFTGAIVGGNADGEFYLEVNATRIALIRNSASARTISAQIWNPVTVNSGGIISIKAKNVSYRKQSRQFEATINGYNLNS